MITQADEFNSLCDRLAQAEAIAFDTEFLSEASYRPQLCLLQFATVDEVVAVDPLAVHDLSRWWELMADPDLLVIIHGGREEIRFCLREGNCTPQNLVDVQIAEGLLSRGYPLGYSQLVQRVTGRSVHGKHTRSDWSRRPLSSDQVRYALEDVEHLPEVWKRQLKNLQKQGRGDWARAECERFVANLADEPRRGDWRRINGSQRLSRREMAILERLHDWRDREAEARDRPPRFIFRDDLLIEIAKIQPDTAEELHHVRGLERNNFRRHTDAILNAVQQGKAVSEAELPRKNVVDHSLPDTEALGKLLSIALANRCAEQSVSTSLVGTTADLHDLIRWHVHQKRQGPPPKLMQGWREEVCGDLLADLMDGKVTLRVTDPTSDCPLVFEAYRGEYTARGQC
ncbi:MAG: ribonuclease D [Planctomycetaceae bacterium]